ncbi:T9SS type A sorting domain-containing protein [Lutimonas vermicola]|uniref:T9SS type A sorting domain-containing protein n=1 Tax=Lutimonas vermicola TaxID=414288 RepID=A0ABU9KWH9_9FLAO
MKKLLLSFVVLIFLNFSVRGQVVELMGMGIKSKTSATLEIADQYNIKQADLFAVSKGLNTLPPIDGVLFDNEDSPSSNWIPIVGSQYLSYVKDESIGYYTRSFANPLNEKFNASIKIEDYVHSFYAYVYRTSLTASYKSVVNVEQVFMYHNGSAKKYVYTLDIGTETASRDLTIKVPISELDEGQRMIVIEIEAGPKYQRFVENTYNSLGNSLLIGEYQLKDVPGNISEVTISIYSPDPGSDNLNGDSFFVGGVIADVEKVFNGCTLTQGYWKTHSTCKKNGNGPKRDDTWDLIEGGKAEKTVFFESGKDYCEVFNTNPGKGGKYYILAHQYIAAELNLHNDADPSDIASTFDEATKFLHENTPEEVNNNKDLQQMCVRLGGILDDFNNGRIGPGHCDDKDEYTEKIAIKVASSKNKVNVFPNPVRDVGKIAFTSKQSGDTRIELYNISGQKVGDLYNGVTKKGADVLIEFSTLHLKRGLYFALVKNGNDTMRHKISITN